jgi:hypothetical protein
LSGYYRTHPYREDDGSDANNDGAAHATIVLNMNDNPVNRDLTPDGMEEAQPF